MSHPVIIAGLTGLVVYLLAVMSVYAVYRATTYVHRPAPFQKDQSRHGTSNI
jgi:hypothetical protein